MSNQYLKLRRSSVPGRVPTTASLDFGEIALNTHDGLAFIKKSGSNGEEVITIGATATVSGSQYFIPVFSGSGVTESTIFQSGSFIGFPNATEPVDPNNPDLLYISGAGVDTYNLISAHSYRNGYVQLNIQNFSPGNLASSDIVATANNGNESNYYIDMGINSEGYSNANLIGSANDAYVYSTGNDLYIGNASANKRLILFNGGFDTLNYSKVFVHDQGTIGINSSTYNAANPPSLFVNSRDSVTTNVIQAKADADDFTEVSHANLNAGTAASADFVAYNDIDPEGQSSGYVDMGINSTNYVYNGIYPGTAGDAYVYTDSHHLILGTISQSVESKVTIFAGGVSETDNAKLVLYGSNQHVMTGSLNASQGFTGSLYGTASWALNTLTASFVATASWSQRAVTASLALTASSADNFIVRQDITASNALFTGTITAQRLNVQYITASTEYVTGSSKFGSLSTDTHQFTGSVSVSGSLSVVGPLNATSSWALNALTASYVPSTAIIGDLSRIATGSVTASVGVGTASFQVTSGSSNLLFVSTSGVLYASSAISVGSPSTDFGNFNTLLFLNGLGSGYNAQLRSSGTGNLLFVHSNSGTHITMLSTNRTDLGQSVGVNTPTFGWTQSERLTIKTTDALGSSTGIWIGNGSTNNNIFKVYGDGTVSIGQTIAPGYALQISGSTSPSGSLNVNNVLTISSSVVTITGSFVVTGSTVITGSLNAPNITGSLFGTASWAQNAVTASYVTGSVYTSTNPVLSASYALSSSYTLTASYALNAATASSFPFTGSAIISGALLVTGSVSATQGGFTGSLLGTSSWAQNVLTASYVTASNVYGPYGSSSVLTSSYALTASYVIGGASTINIQDEGSPQGSAGTINFVGDGVNASVGGGVATVTITGGGGGSITVADEGVAQGTATFLNFIGNGVTATVSSNTASIVINATGSTALHTQASPATTWIFNHNLGNLYPVLNVWDSSGFMVMPGGVKTINTNQLEIYFDVAQSGYASAVVGGVAVSASYALTASYALNGGGGPATVMDNIASGVVTASVANSPNGIFLIKSGSVNMFEISGSGGFTANSSLFIIKNYTTQQPVFTVSESVVKFATQSSAPTGNADNGAFWFTGTDLYIGLN